MPTSSCVLLAGYLWKKKKNNKTGILTGGKYSKRYFELTAATLTYAANERELRSGEGRIEVFAMHEMKYIKKLDEWRFEVKFPERSLKLKGEHIKDPDAWIEALQQAHDDTKANVPKARDRERDRDRDRDRDSNNSVPKVRTVEVMAKKPVPQLKQHSVRVDSDGEDSEGSMRRPPTPPKHKPPPLDVKLAMPVTLSRPQEKKPPSPRSMLANPRMGHMIIASKPAEDRDSDSEEFHPNAIPRGQKQQQWSESEDETSRPEPPQVYAKPPARSYREERLVMQQVQPPAPRSPSPQDSVAPTTTRSAPRDAPSQPQPRGGWERNQAQQGYEAEEHCSPSMRAQQASYGSRAQQVSRDEYGSPSSNRSYGSPRAGGFGESPRQQDRQYREERQYREPERERERAPRGDVLVLGPPKPPKNSAPEPSMANYANSRGQQQPSRLASSNNSRGSSHTGSAGSRGGNSYTATSEDNDWDNWDSDDEERRPQQQNRRAPPAAPPQRNSNGRGYYEEQYDDGNRSNGQRPPSTRSRMPSSGSPPSARQAPPAASPKHQQRQPQYAPRGGNNLRADDNFAEENWDSDEE